MLDSTLTSKRNEMKENVLEKIVKGRSVLQGMMLKIEVASSEIFLEVSAKRV